MARNRNTHYLLLGLLTLGAVTLSGCSKDESYDLEDIDTTIGIGLDHFTVPGINSTMEIPLNDLFDIDGNEVVYADATTGEYIFSKGVGGSDVTPARPRIDDIVVGQTSLGEYNVDISILNNLPKLDPSLPAAAVDAAFDLALQQVPAVLEAEGVITEFVFSTELPDEVLSLSEVTADNTGGLSTMTIHLGFSDGLAAVLNCIDQLDLSLPEYLDLTVNGLKPVNGKVSLYRLPRNGIDLNIQIEKIGQFLSAVPSTGDNYVAITSLPSGKQQLTIAGKLTVGMKIKKEDLNTTPLKQQLMNTGVSYTYQLTTGATMQDIKVHSATGTFKPNIDLGNIGDIEISGLPDFLDGDNVRLVVDNPQIYIDIESDLGLDGKLTGVSLTGRGEAITANVVNGVGSRVIQVPDDKLVIKRNAKTSFVIFDEKNASKLTPPQGRSLSEYTRVAITGTERVTNPRTGETLEIGRLASLLYEIPDAITFSATGTTTTDEGTVLLGHDYTITPGYEFKAPLALGKGSYVLYRDSIDGWEEDLSDISLAKPAAGKPAAEITVRATAINKVPLGLTLVVDPKYKEGTPASLKNGIVTKVGKLIEAGSEASPKRTDLEITLTVNDQNAFDYLDGLKFEALAESITEGEAQALKKSGQTLKFENIGVTITGKVTMNLDDDDDEYK